MAPQGDHNVSKSKCHLESRDGKQKLFSFRWLLRKSKSTRSAKEIMQPEKPVNVPSSKSCDTGMNGFEAVDRCPRVLLWKLLPLTGKNVGHSKLGACAVREKLPLRTSFSCNDVYSMVPTVNVLCSTESSQDLNLTNQNASRMKYPSLSWYRLCKSNTHSSNLDNFSKGISIPKYKTVISQPT
ncbi:uncharacterized protein LOC118180610 [Stegodyphus dumicola]|uniref:uncharacterized protein LOC118180610 n=1 Tax=Stegodyphus dumicola TaxID=202533 RepID=UPI0015ADF515|nr:uncharacterized protein LOC118180610 [Stegodyphus dumicola]